MVRCRHFVMFFTRYMSSSAHRAVPAPAYVKEGVMHFELLAREAAEAHTKNIAGEG
jgi:hypothetical protein